VKPRRLKSVLASLKSVLPGMIPQKQGTSQFKGSRKRGSSVALAISGSSVSTGVGGRVGESVALSFVSMGGESVALGPVPVMTGVSVTAGIIVAVAGSNARDGSCLLWVGCIVAPTGTHPVKARTGIIKRDNQDVDFIIRPFLRIVGLLEILINIRSQCISYEIIHFLSCGF
jgi:hypothetical protein